MARPKYASKRRSSRSRSRNYSSDRGARKDLLLGGGIVALVAVLGSLAYLGISLSRPGVIDETTLCHVEGPVNQSVILLDLTDPMNTTQRARLRNMLDTEVADSNVDTMISLGVVSDDPVNWGVRFAKCKPETGEYANSLYENPTLIAARYDSEFLRPLQDTLDELVGGEAESQSPIMEALQSLVSQTPDFSATRGQRKLVIVSDMLQHSDTLSFYRGQGWDHFTGTSSDERLAGNLRGVDVEIIRIPRAGSNLPDSNDVEDFWTRYFDKQGSRPPMVRSLGDL